MAWLKCVVLPVDRGQGVTPVLMGTRTLQHVFAMALVPGALLCAQTHAQVVETQPSAQPTGSIDSAETPLPLPGDLLSRSKEQEQTGDDKPTFSVDPLKSLRPSQTEQTTPDPLRRRRGGLWSVGEQWSVGVGMLRAGGPRPENRDRPDALSEPTWMDVQGVDGLVHMLDASVSWVVDPTDAVQVSFEGGLRTLARSNQASARSINLSPTFLDGGLITQPVMGAAVRWALNDWAYIEGSATSNFVDVAGSFLDLTAQASVNLTTHTALIAGYRYLDASFDSAESSATLSQDALFAMIQIRY